jgi:hypothetical protein
VEALGSVYGRKPSGSAPRGGRHRTVKCDNCKVKFRNGDELVEIYEYVVESKHGDYVKHKKYVHVDSRCAQRRAEVLERRAKRDKERLASLTAVKDGTYGDHCGSGTVHDPHNWDNDDGRWYCMGTYIPGGGV